MSFNICMIRSNPIRPDSRVEKEALALISAGFNVHILSWDRDSDHEQINGFILEEKVPITWLGYKATFGEGFKNLKAYLKFQFHMRKWLRQNAKNFDAIHACDFDTAFFSMGVAKRLRKKFVFDIFDFLYGEPKGILQNVVKCAQKQLINKSDATIICTEERKRQIKGTNPKSLIVVHNTPPMIDINSSKAGCVEGILNIVYVGILQDYRLLKELPNVMARHPQWHLDIGGFGKYEELFLNAQMQMNNITFHGRLAYKETLELEEKADIILAIYDPCIENHRFAAPNKFYEGLMLGKPLVMVNGTGMSNEVKENDIGVLIEYSEEGLEKGLVELLNRKKDWPEMQQRMQQLYLQKYDWRIMERRLIDMYCEMKEGEKK